MKRIINKLIRHEEGIALPIILILMVIGGLIIAPLLSYVSSGLIVGQTYEAIADELYAADAGVEDGLWQIGYNNLDDLFGSYDRYDYDTDYDYPASYPVVVNGMDVDVTIENIWVPDIDSPDVDEANQLIGAGKLIITGNVPAEKTHQIKIYYYKEESDGDLQINEIGIWIPPSFNYDDTVECTLETHLDSIGKNYSREIYPHCGGEAVVWTLTDVFFTNLPDVETVDHPMASTISFKYTTTLENRNPEAISWITTSGVSDIPYAWDADVKVYHITSEAGGLGGTTVEAYAVKSELRELGSAISGDYRAIGNTLMVEGDAGYNPNDIRYELLSDSDATADDIPSAARVEAAYLYWSAWVFEAPEDVEFWDECTDMSNWIPGSCWHQSGSYTAFYAHYSGGSRELEMLNQVNLSGYESGTVIASWRHWLYWRNIESGDCLQYAFSNAGGWGDWNTAFCDDTQVGTSPVSFSVTIPDEYLTDSFKIKFRITGFGDNNEICYIDNVKIAAQSGEIADTSVIFKIDGDQVYFADDAYGNPTVPTIGSEEITADEWQVLENFTGSGDPNGFSYSSFKDVTGLVQEFANQGNATYTVGEVYGDTEDQWSYAAWSLIIIYASPETKGHQLYLYDDFVYSDMNCNVDFDGDGAGGGTISGFLVPDPIAGEENAATITCFVGEGDDCWDGDYIALNAPSMPASNSYKLWDGTAADSLNNVWNSKSLEISEDGIDIDTFYVTWASDLLEPGDTSAQVDMWTEDDSWNLIYVILSFRSETVTGGTVTYLIRG